ncbi:MAG TPA: lysophospholipid acyltransferase family protein [Gemmatimonadales bacterium]|nr:lysophospholipid acyltransferase family protein [Gemmatimonadales bacterium]
MSVRTLWYYAVLAATTIVHATVAVVAGLFRVRNRVGGVYDWAGTDWARDILRAAGTPVVAEGLENIPRDRPVIYASNHSSMFDIWALFATLPGSLRFVAKQELFKIPLLSRAMRAVGHIPIDRAAHKKAFAAYDEAARMIQRGTSSIVVFPEGTRSRTGELLPFKNAPFGLAIAAQVPVVPVYVHHTFEILPKGAWRLRPRPIQLLVAPPISTTGLRPEDRERLRDEVRAAMVALQSKAR